MRRTECAQRELRSTTIIAPPPTNRQAALPGSRVRKTKILRSPWVSRERRRIAVNVRGIVTASFSPPSTHSPSHRKRGRSPRERSLLRACTPKSSTSCVRSESIFLTAIRKGSPTSARGERRGSSRWDRGDQCPVRLPAHDDRRIVFPATRLCPDRAARCAARGPGFARVQRNLSGLGRGDAARTLTIAEGLGADGRSHLPAARVKAL